jgi:hypothetical protein
LRLELIQLEINEDLTMKTSLSRRKILKTSVLTAGAGLTASSWLSQTLDAGSPSNAAAYAIAPGPFQPTWGSLEQNYKLPDWYHNAKFGAWMHWGRNLSRSTVTGMRNICMTSLRKEV